MTKGLVRYQQCGCFHFLTFSCHRQLPHLGTARSHLGRIIADRGYDSDALRMRLKRRGTELIVPYRRKVRNRRFEDQRKAAPIP